MVKTKIESVIRLFMIAPLLAAMSACGGGEAEPQIRSVKVAEPQPRSGGYVRNYPAIVKESNETGLGFKTAGQIAHVYVKEGDYVRQGQLLATLDAADYQLAVNALQAQYDQLKSEFGRVEQLFERKGMSRNEYEKAKAGVEQLYNQLQANKNKLSYTKLYAPSNGYIQTVNFSKAEMVDAGTQVFSILDDDGMKVEFDVPVSESGIVNASAKYTMTYNGGQSEVPVAFISKSPKADGNQLYTIRLGVGPSTGLTPGMNATVGVATTADDDNATTGGYNLPLRAVVDKDGRASVWVLNPDSTVTMKAVVFAGMDKNGMAIIESGIEAGDKVISAGVNSLHEGEKVKVIDRESETNVGGLL